MLALSLPMAVMYVLSEIICRVSDNRKGITFDEDTQTFIITDKALVSVE